MRYFVRGRLPFVTPTSPRKIGPVAIQSESFEYSNDCDGDWRDDARRIELCLHRTLGLSWGLWTAPERTSVRQDTPDGPSLENYLPMTTRVAEPLTAEPIVDADSCFEAVLAADEELAKLLSVYMDALGNRGPGSGDHFRAWAFALIIDAWGDGEGAWDKRCEELVQALDSSGYEITVSGQNLARIRHEALKFRNWRQAEHDPEDLRQLGHVARGYLLLRLGLLDSL